MLVEEWQLQGHQSTQLINLLISFFLFVSFQESIRSFISDTCKEDVLIMRVQDPFHRLLLHGVCEVFPPG